MDIVYYYYTFDIVIDNFLEMIMTTIIQPFYLRYYIFIVLRLILTIPTDFSIAASLY